MQAAPAGPSWAGKNPRSAHLSGLCGECQPVPHLRVICMLAVVMICFFNRSVFVASVLLIIYGLYFILYPYFSYQAIIPFFQQYNQMLYGFLNREYDTVVQTQDEVFFQNNQREMKGLMKKYNP